MGGGLESRCVGADGAVHGTIRTANILVTPTLKVTGTARMHARRTVA